MKIKIIKGVKVKKLYAFKDFRGKYIETFNIKNFPKIKFLQDDLSYSKKNILRGFHGDSKTWKLFTCVYGKVQFAAINFDKKSKNFKNNFTTILSDKNNLQILVPPKYGVAHLVLSKNAVLGYKQSTLYGKVKQFTINYKSPCLNFKWKSKKIRVSKRDSGGLCL